MEQTGSPYISVIIMAYKSVRFGNDAVNSVNCNEFDRSLYEVILVLMDPDDSAEYDPGSYSSVMIYKGRKFGDCIMDSVRKCRGDVICFLDDDDIFFPGKLKTVYDYFTRYNDLSYLHNHFVHNQNCVPVSTGKTPEHIILNQENLHDFKRNSRKAYYLNNSSWSVKKAELIRAAQFISKVNLSLDVSLFSLAMSSAGKFIHIEKNLSMYRLHDKNRTSGINRRDWKDMSPLSEDCITIYGYAIGPDCRFNCDRIAAWAILIRISSSLINNDMTLRELIGILNNYSKIKSAHRTGLAWRLILYFTVPPKIFNRLYQAFNKLILA